MTKNARNMHGIYIVIVVVDDVYALHILLKCGTYISILFPCNIRQFGKKAPGDKIVIFNR